LRAEYLVTVLSVFGFTSIAIPAVLGGRNFGLADRRTRVEDGFRFDVTDVDATPKTAANKTSKPATTSTSANK
jgi:hypothetical protein